MESSVEKVGSTLDHPVITSANGDEQAATLPEKPATRVGSLHAESGPENRHGSNGTSAPISKVYKVITDKIVEMLEQGTVPWRKPWIVGPASRSYYGHEYRGINQLLLPAMASLHGLKGCWITFKQVKQLGGKVKKGAKSVPVVFWKWIEKEDPKGEGNKKFPLCRYYRVFSICQTEGIKEPGWLKKVEADKSEIEPLEAAQAIWENFQAKPLLRQGGDQAAYYPDVDQISMPEMDRFNTAESYYSTLYHEATHATGHPRRMDRFSADRHAAFGSESYSKEELVAEMGAAFLAAEAGIEDTRQIENAASYLQSWIRVLKGDPKLVVTAGAQAQKAVDHILGRTFEEDEKGGES